MIKRKQLWNSIVSSLLLFLCIFYGQKIWSKIWVLSVFLDIPIIIYFLFITFSNFKYLVKHFNEGLQSCIPFLIQVVTFAVIFFFPLNWIRNYSKFVVCKPDYQLASNIVMNEKLDTSRNFLILPPRFESLSENGKVKVAKQGKTKAVLFFTFLGIPDGLQGFVYVKPATDTSILRNQLFNEIYKIKVLGNGWYFVSGD